MSKPMIKSSPNFALSIKNRRQELGYTIKTAAQMAKISEKTWSKYENGEDIYEGNLPAISEALRWNYKSMRRNIVENKKELQLDKYMFDELEKNIYLKTGKKLTVGNNASPFTLKIIRNFSHAIKLKDTGYAVSKDICDACYLSPDTKVFTVSPEIIEGMADITLSNSVEEVKNNIMDSIGNCLPFITCKIKGDTWFINLCSSWFFTEDNVLMFKINKGIYEDEDFSIAFKNPDEELEEIVNTLSNITFGRIEVKNKRDYDTYKGSTIKKEPTSSKKNKGC